MAGLKDQLTEAMVEVFADGGPVHKLVNNEFNSGQFVKGIRRILSAVHPAMADERVLPLSRLVDRGPWLNKYGSEGKCFPETEAERRSRAMNRKEQLEKQSWDFTYNRSKTKPDHVRHGYTIRQLRESLRNRIGLSIDDSQVSLPENTSWPLTDIRRTYHVRIELHPDVSATLPIKVHAQAFGKAADHEQTGGDRDPIEEVIKKIDDGVLTVEDVASACGTTVARIDAWLTGESKPNAKNLSLLEDLIAAGTAKEEF